MTELTKRILFGVLAAPAFLAVGWLGSWYFEIMILILVWLMQWELSSMFKTAQAPVNLTWSFVSGAVVLFHMHNPLLLASIIVLLIALVMPGAIRSDEQRFKRIVYSVFIGVYIPLLMSTMLILRSTGSDVTGFMLLVLLLFMVWGNDTMAYVGGKLFGKHAMAPKISPKKTWEGFASGFIGSAIGFGLAMYFMPPEAGLSINAMWPIIILVSICGPIGDLTESRMKRHVNLKDSGALLPGHGGVLDRFDALLLATPVMWVYLEIIRWFNIINY